VILLTIQSLSQTTLTESPEQKNLLNFDTHFIIISRKMSWKYAMMWCMAEKGDLASIRSRSDYGRVEGELAFEERKFRSKEIRSHKRLSKESVRKAGEFSYKKQHYWVGANDILAENHWQWPAATVNFEKSGLITPNTTLNANCGTVMTQRASEMTFAAVKCTRKLPFICLVNHK